jgi:hypothetical protein
MYVVAALIAKRKSAVLRKPGQRALHNPPVSPQLLATVYALSCYAALYPTPSQGSFTLLVVVGFVGVHLLGTFPRSAPARTLDGLYSVDEFFEDHRVVDVCGREHYREGDAPSVRNKVALRALLSYPSDSLRFLAPLLAGMEAESSAARSHSIWSASPRRSSKTRCILSHTPASCHSFRRRQQVIPEPQPICFLWEHLPGNTALEDKHEARESHPVVDAWSSALGLWWFGGRSGSMVSQSSSVTSSLAMSSAYPVNGFVRLT